LGTVTLPNTSFVGGTFDGTYYMAPEGVNGIIRIYTPPVGGNGAATLVATEDASPNNIGAITWDPNRGMLWGAFADNVYLIDLGNKTVSGPVVSSTFMFNPGVGGSGLIDGIAYDGGDDTLYYSPDVDLNVYQFSLGTDINGANPALGTLMNTIAPENAGGVADGLVSGVAIGSANTLYIGRNGDQEIRRVDKTTGAFVSTFAQTVGRAEGLVCDSVTYASKSAILSKEAFGDFYEAFEVEAGTCPLLGDPPPASVGGATSFLVTESGTSAGMIAILAGVAAIAFTLLVATGWYARRRLQPGERSE